MKAEWIQPFMLGTLSVIVIALVLRNPSGTKAAGQAAGTLYGDIVSSFVKPS